MAVDPSSHWNGIFGLRILPESFVQKDSKPAPIAVSLGVGFDYAVGESFNLVSRGDIFLSYAIANGTSKDRIGVDVGVGVSKCVGPLELGSRLNIALSTTEAVEFKPDFFLGLFPKKSVMGVVTGVQVAYAPWNSHEIFLGIKFLFS